MVAGASDGAAVDRSRGASGNFRASSTGVCTACESIRRAPRGALFSLAVQRRCVGVGPPFRLGLRLGGGEGGLLLDELLVRRLLCRGRRRGLLLGALGGRHRLELVLGGELAALRDDDELHLDLYVLEEVDRHLVAPDPL